MLNQTGLKITSAKIVYHQKNKVIEHVVSRINHLPSFEEVRLHTNSPLYPGNYQIILQFGPLKARDLKLLESNVLSEIKLRSLLPSFDNQEARTNARFEIVS